MILLDKADILRVTHVFKQYFDISDEKLNPVNWQIPLTGTFYGFTAVDLVYLLFELEKEFKIKISYELLEGYQFSTIAGICNIVYETILTAH